MKLEVKKCPNCGSNEIVVEETREYTQAEFGRLDCDCGECEGEDGIAAESESYLHFRDVRRGSLVDGSIDWTETETKLVEVETFDPTIYSEECYENSSYEGAMIVKDEALEPTIYCEECYENSMYEWEFERDEIFPDSIEIERIINCRNCGFEF